MTLASTLFITATVAIVACAICVLIGPHVRVNYYIQSAVKALEARDYDTAEHFYRKLEMQPGLRDSQQRMATRFIRELGLGSCYQGRDDFAGSERHYACAVELWEQGVEQQRSVIAHMFVELAIAQHAQGKIVDSNRSLERVRQVLQAAGRAEISDIIEMLTGAACGPAGRNHLDIAFEIVRIAQAALDRSDPWHGSEIAHTQLTLASFHMMHCEYGSARELIEAALQSAGDALDRNDLGCALFDLGQIEKAAGNLAKSKEALERCLKIRSEEEGETHWQTSIVIEALADAYRLSGEYDGAKQFSDKAWRIQSDQLTDNDMILAGTAITRAMLLIDLGDFKDADKILVHADEIAGRSGGAQNSLLAGVLLVQGISKHTQNRYTHADELLRQSFAIAEETYGAEHRMTCDSRTILASNWIRLGRFDRAEVMLAETLSIHEALFDVSVLDLADTLLILADLYLETDRVSDSEAAVLRARNLIEHRVPSTHLIRAKISEILGRIRKAHMEFDLAIDHFEHALVVRGKAQPSDHPEFADLLEAYAHSLTSVGNTQKATEQLAKVEQIRRKYPTE